jgi:hypothetical protein
LAGDFFAHDSPELCNISERRLPPLPPGKGIRNERPWLGNLNRAVPKKFREPVNGGIFLSFRFGKGQPITNINLPHPVESGCIAIHDIRMCVIYSFSQCGLRRGVNFRC